MLDGGYIAEARSAVADMRRRLAIGRCITLNLSGGIGEAFARPRGILADDVVRALQAAPDRWVSARIDTAGGAIAEAIRIFDALRRHHAPTAAFIPARAHSAGAVIAAAFTHRTAAPSATFLLHPAGIEPNTITAPSLTATQLRDMADATELATTQMIDCLAARCGRRVPRSWIADKVRAGTTLDAEAALRCGLVDRIAGRPLWEAQ